MKTFELIVAISQEFSIEVSPDESERDRWTMPIKVIVDPDMKVTI